MSRNPIDVFVEALPAALGPILSKKASSPWTITVDEKLNLFPAGTELLSLLLVAEPSKAEAAIQLSMDGTLLLAGALGGATAVPTQFQPEHAQTVRAALAEACGNAAALLDGTQIKLQLTKAISWTAAKQVSLTASNGTSNSVQFQMLFTADWPTASATAPVRSSQVPKSLELSMLENVEIDVVLQFGERRLPLREIGELRSGSVIELDKYVQDPAELLLGDRIIARGEVVVVDGNYGLRVTEVVDPK
jgi:flagellar motor switch protein FliN/FliY